MQSGKPLLLLVRKSLWVLVFLLLPSPDLPVAMASPGSQAEKAVTLLTQKNYSGALEVLHSLEKTLSNPANIANMLAIAYLGQA